MRGSRRPIHLRLLWRLSPLLLLLLCSLLPACSLDGLGGGGVGDSKTLALVTIFPTTGPDAAIGLALQQAVALAVKPNGSLTNGYKVIAQNIDEASPLREGSLATALSNPRLVGVIGPYSSETAVALLPEIAAAGVATISPTATLTGLTQSAAADAEGVPFGKLHPQGKPLSFFRLAPTDDALGKAAADEAVAATSAKGLAAGAELRNTLSIGGAPGVPILAAGPVADNPGWSAAVGQPILAANTTGLLPASDLTKLDSAKSFLSAWQEAYGAKVAPPQSALAYDAAMAEIAAIKAVIASGKPVTRSAIATALAATKFDGATGSIAFDEHGDSTAAPAFSVYSCDAKGAWSYQTTLHG